MNTLLCRLYFRYKINEILKFPRYNFNKTLLQQQHIVFLDVKIPYQVLLYMIKMVYSGRYIIIGSYRTIFKKTSYRLNRRLFADIIR